jgi:hypothetical protein
MERLYFMIGSGVELKEIKRVYMSNWFYNTFTGTALEQLTVVLCW